MEISQNERIPTGHIPVLPAEVLELLAPMPGEVFVDVTVGLGGHAQLLAQRLGPSGRLLALDRDEAALQLAQQRTYDCPVDWTLANFRRLRDVLDQWQLTSVDGVLADFGVSSMQLDLAERGFSFAREGPLDMRMDPSRGESAADLLARLPERELARIFWEYGEERYSRQVAARIVSRRQQAPLRTTTELAELVRAVVPVYRPLRTGRGRPVSTIDPATRVFQGLRIAVNSELESIEQFLTVLPACVRPGGRVALISFHSLEDRLVKNALRQGEIWEVLTKKPITASETELQANPRSRSAKIRAACRR